MVNSYNMTRQEHDTPVGLMNFGSDLRTGLETAYETPKYLEYDVLQLTWNSFPLLAMPGCFIHEMSSRDPNCTHLLYFQSQHAETDPTCVIICVNTILVSFRFLIRQNH